jgi:hypothetical protein
MLRQAISAEFDDAVTALDAGERARSAAGASGVVQVLLPSKGRGGLQPTAVLWTRGGRSAVLVIGAVVGLAFAIGIYLGTGHLWAAIPAVISATLFAVMIYFWLTGTATWRTRRAELDAHDLEAVRAGHSIVRAELFGRRATARVLRVLEEAGAQHIET